ncbi:MAG: 5-formyltetrahydrofolate cyclo-ligase [Bacteroidota bacterium]
MSERETVAAQKARLRARFREVRSGLGADHRTNASRLIRSRLGDVLPEAGVVSAFWPLPGEVDLRLWLRHLAASGTTVALPITTSAPGEPPRLVHRAMEGDLVRGRFGVMEPSAAAVLVEPREIAVAIVPALAISREGVRLGYGGGFYDAFLAETPALRVGVAFAACLANTLPAEPHDARLDVIVTEREVLRPDRGA